MTDELSKAIARAIEKVGMSQFKKCSMFGSNKVND